MENMHDLICYYNNTLNGIIRSFKKKKKNQRDICL